MEPVTLAGRFLIALVLLLAGAAKIRRADELARAVSSYRLLPDRAVRPVAVLLPWIELACGLALAAGIATRLVAAVVVCLFAVFTGAVAVGLLRGQRIDCGCFGEAQGNPANRWTVARNIVLSVIAGLVALYPPGALSAIPQGVHSDVSPTDGLAILIVTVALFLSGVTVRHTVAFLGTGGAES